jgi:hypothetical protein
MRSQIMPTTTFGPKRWEVFVKLLAGGTDRIMMYNIIVQTVLQIARHNRSGVFSVFQIVHVMPQPDSNHSRRVMRKSRLMIHGAIDRIVLGRDYVDSSSPGWIEVAPESWNDGLFNMVVPVPEWFLYQHDQSKSRYQYNLVDGKALTAAMDQDTWKQEWLE